jgi:hypothetical protein
MAFKQGCQIFLGTTYQNGENIQNDYKIYQMAIKYFQWQLNRPNARKIYQDFILQDQPKFTQIGIFGLKTNHLATLLSSSPGRRVSSHLKLQ